MFTLSDIQNALLELNSKFCILENSQDDVVSSGKVALAESLRGIIMDLSCKIEFLLAKLKKHNKQFIDINSEMKDTYLVINGITRIE